MEFRSQFMRFTSMSQTARRHKTLVAHYVLAIDPEPYLPTAPERADKDWPNWLLVAEFFKPPCGSGTLIGAPIDLFDPRRKNMRMCDKCAASRRAQRLRLLHEYSMYREDVSFAGGRVLEAWDFRGLPRALRVDASCQPRTTVQRRAASGLAR